jgi:hypothetical protein
LLTAEILEFNVLLSITTCFCWLYTVKGTRQHLCLFWWDYLQELFLI